MSAISEAMREACINPVFTVDEQIMKVTNCTSSGDTVVPGGVEPQVIPLEQSPHEAKGTIDADAINPGEDSPQTDPKVDPPAPVQESGVVKWVKENPVIVVGLGVFLLMMVAKKGR